MAESNREIGGYPVAAINIPTDRLTHYGLRQVCTLLSLPQNACSGVHARHSAATESPPTTTDRLITIHSPALSTPHPVACTMPTVPKLRSHCTGIGDWLADCGAARQHGIWRRLPRRRPPKRVGWPDWQLGRQPRPCVCQHNAPGLIRQRPLQCCDPPGECRVCLLFPPSTRPAPLCSFCFELHILAALCASRSITGTQHFSCMRLNDSR